MPASIPEPHAMHTNAKAIHLFSISPISLILNVFFTLPYLNHLATSLASVAVIPVHLNSSSLFLRLEGAFL